MTFLRVKEALTEWHHVCNMTFLRVKEALTEWQCCEAQKRYHWWRRMCLYKCLCWTEVQCGMCWCWHCSLSVTEGVVEYIESSTTNIGVIWLDRLKERLLSVHTAVTWYWVKVLSAERFLSVTWFELESGVCRESFDCCQIKISFVILF